MPASVGRTSDPGAAPFPWHPSAMSKQDDIRAQIIAAQAAREAIEHPPGQKKKPRSNWAASPPMAPSRRLTIRRGERK